MKTKRNTMTSSKLIALGTAILVTGFLASASVAAPEKKAEKKEAAAKQQDAQGTPQPGQKQFDTPKQAADALIQVATNLDVAAAKEILGPDGEDIVASDDPVMDKKRATEFADKAKEKMSVETSRKTRYAAWRVEGKQKCPRPITAVKQNAK